MALHLSSLAHLSLWTVWIGLVIVFIANFARKAWHARRYMRLLQKQGLPMPPHHIIIGHLGLVASIQKNLPSDAHGHYLAGQIRQRYPDLGPVFYLDLWPFSDPLLIVTDPDVIAQFCAPDHLLPKHPGVKTFMYPITGGYDLNCLDGETWKFWRKLFNPGFSAAHMQTLVPTIVDEVEIFRKELVDRAREGRMFSFENHALSLAIDVIGRVALDTKLNIQGQPSPWISALLHQRQWAAFGLEMGIWMLVNPMRYFHMWNNRRIMDKYIDRDLDSRYSATQQDTKSKTIIDLALKAYKSERIPPGNDKGPIDAIFRRYARSQMKVFIFAGHDATSTTICYSWLLLSRNPQAMAKIRDEHDAVLGPDPNTAASVLSANPVLLNRLTYTLAVIKETLRIFPVVSSPRGGLKNFILTDSKGQRFPTANCLVWAVHHGLHHNPLWWPRAGEFLPERFLPDQDRPDELRPLKNAWRPFELGPRACIGTELAMTELKIVLALTARDFDLQEAFAEWDRVNKPKGVKTVDGERAYQIQLGSAHPADGFPVRIFAR
ncbi:cytochrome P450 monooxygenase-like protein [Byssothecium circinans]|uniref:Cytochrome P450 monooxygenase-like protein n=1 Tax=Byssothecium circinans TaxID=147558 RepID=A0A6A5U6P3_9PLEO|nr:cytochrome P450 monooxygenase-like protein [Byssothecium circinans]